MAFIGSVGKVISDTVKNIGKILQDPAALATIALMAWINPIGTLGYLASAAVYTGVMAMTSALSPTPDMPNFNTNAFVGELQGRTQTIKQPAQPRQVIYGECRVGGVISFIGTSDKKNKFLFMLVAYAGHEINKFKQHRIDDRNVTVKGSTVTAPSIYIQDKADKERGVAKNDKLVRIYERLGTGGQSALSLFNSTFKSFTKDHQFKGVALVGYRFTFDDKAYPNGLPNVSAIIQGAKIRRVSNLSDPKAYRNLSADVIYDYMTNTVYGMGLNGSEIDLPSFVTARTICNQDVPLSGGNTEKRYVVNGAFKVNQSHKNVLSQLLQTCLGQLTYQNGKFSLTVGAARTPVMTLTQDDLRGAVDIKTKQSIADQYNTVKGIFVNPAGERYVPTDFKKVTSSTFVSEDNGVERILDFPQNMQTSHARAQRIAKAILYRSRQAITLSTRVSLKAFNLKAGDWVYVTLPRFGFDQKVFEVASWTLAPVSTETLAVELLLRETNSAIFDWDAEEDVFDEDNSDLPDPFKILPPTMTLAQTVQVINQKATSVIEVTLAAQDSYSTTFEVDVQRTARDGVSTPDTQVISLGRSASTVFEYLDVKTGDTYTVRSRSRSNLGTISNRVVQTIVIAGKGTATLPSDVSDLSLNYQGSNAVLTWTPLTDEDLSHYEIRHQNVTSGEDFANAIVLAEKVARPANQITVAGLTGTYFCIAVDKYGNRSSLASKVKGIIQDNPSTSGFATIGTITESQAATAFAGTKTDVYVFDDGGTKSLRLQSVNNFDSVTGNFDDAIGLFDGGSKNVSASGTYEFANHTDLGSKQTFRLVGTDITFTRADYGPYAGTGNALTRSANGGANVVMQIATTDDDPSGSPTYTAFSDVSTGDYTARAFKLRLKLTSALQLDGTRWYSPAITLANATTHAEIKVQTGQDIASGTSAKVVSFTYQYRSLEGLGIAAQNLLSGEYYQITNKTASGFTITFRDSSNAIINRTFDYTASGSGKIAV